MKNKSLRCSTGHGTGATMPLSLRRMLARPNVRLRLFPRGVPSQKERKRKAAMEAYLKDLRLKRESAAARKQQLQDQRQQSRTLGSRLKGFVRSFFSRKVG